MNNSNAFRKYVIFVLINIFLVIIAGSVVRTTQSGMGCPDWPKCFGQYIPPTQMEQVVFQPNKQYNKGQFIKHNDSLWSAVAGFKSSNSFLPSEWKHYNKHGYTKIVIYQTWIEYINRLLGALLGIFVLIQLVWSFRFFKQSKSVFYLSLLLVLLTGFQAWLGKTVVDSNLATVKISIHLAGAIALCFLQLGIMYRLRPTPINLPANIKPLFYALSLGSLIQFFMGVIVRQHVDVVAEQFGYTQRSLWLQSIGTIYYIHRTFSLLLVGLSIYLYVCAQGKYKHLFRPILMLILAQLCLGILFNYADFPAFAQPFHLLLASIQLSYFFYLALANRK